MHHRRKRGGRHRAHRGGFRRPKYNVPVNIWEADDHYEVTVHAVTYDKENIKISVVNGMLYIGGTRTFEEGEGSFILQEYPVKSFERMFELSEQVDVEGITARQEGGVLFIHVPKISAAQHPEHEVSIS